jgi:hypothetical protein
VQEPHGGRQPGHEHLGPGVLDQPHDRPQQPQAAVDVAAETVDDRQRAPGAADPEVVAERLGDADRPFGPAPGQLDPARGEGAAG